MLLTPEFNQAPALPESVVKYSHAIASGVCKSVTGFAHMVAHPLDSLVYPVSSLVYDASIISVSHCEPTLLPGNADYSGFAILKDAINRNPKLYFDARNGMQNRINNAKKAYNNFQDSSLEQQVEALSEIVTSFYLPGGFIRGIKTIKNIQKFDVANPPKFHTNTGNDITMPFTNIKKYSISEIRSVQNWEIMQYVITSDYKLIITPTSVAKPFQRGTTSH